MSQNADGAPVLVGLPVKLGALVTGERVGVAVPVGTDETLGDTEGASSRQIPNDVTAPDVENWIQTRTMSSSCTSTFCTALFPRPMMSIWSEDMSE